MKKILFILILTLIGFLSNSQDYMDYEMRIKRFHTDYIYVSYYSPEIVIIFGDYYGYSHHHYYNWYYHHYNNWYYSYGYYDYYLYNYYYMNYTYGYYDGYYDGYYAGYWDNHDYRNNETNNAYYGHRDNGGDASISHRPATTYTKPAEIKLNDKPAISTYNKPTYTKPNIESRPVYTKPNIESKPVYVKPASSSYSRPSITSRPTVNTTRPSITSRPSISTRPTVNTTRPSTSTINRNGRR